VVFLGTLRQHLVPEVDVDRAARSVICEQRVVANLNRQRLARPRISPGIHSEADLVRGEKIHCGGTGRNYGTADQSVTGLPSIIHSGLRASNSPTMKFTVPSFWKTRLVASTPDARRAYVAEEPLEKCIRKPCSDCSSSGSNSNTS